jgi:LysM repeat protein
LSHDPHAEKRRHGNRRAQGVSVWFVLFVFLAQTWCSVSGSQETPSGSDDTAKIDRGFFVAEKDVENLQDRVFKIKMQRFLAQKGVITRNSKGSIYYFIAEEQIDQISDPELKERITRFITAPLQEASPKTESEVYEIQPGDTLWEVAKEHGMSVGEILYLNDLAPNQPIYPGQKVFVRPK